MNIYRCRLNIHRLIQDLLLFLFVVFLITVTFLFYRDSWKNQKSLPTTVEHTLERYDALDLSEKIHRHDEEFIRRQNAAVEQSVERNAELDTSGKIDWHDEEFIRMENSRVGNGEHGIAAALPPYHDENLCNPQKVFKNLGYSGCLSDHISINRSLPDSRPAGCQYVKYSRNLPKVSVIMPTHNEHWSVLLRAIHSILNRSPETLLKELIIVDDGSSHAHMQKPFDDYVAANLPKVRIFRISFPPQGLMRARVLGAEKATGEVLLFVDSNIEANINWLPPLLEPIREDYKTCVCPVVDGIDALTFQIDGVGQGFRNAFDWTLLWRILPLPSEDQENPTKPFKDATMIGCAFAITSRFFWELGAFDPGLQLWGGEQFELSFKIWQCGGTLLNAPCSRVGHIYRLHGQPIETPVEDDFMGKNVKRVAEVWMDEYAELLSMYRGPNYRSVDPGDLSKQLGLRRKLNCKPFKWYLEEIAPDVLEAFPPNQPPDYGSGKISSILDSRLCLKMEKNIRLAILEECFDYIPDQDFLLSWHKDIRSRGFLDCLEVSEDIPFAPVSINGCHETLGNQLWRYDLETQQLLFGPNGDRCLACDVKAKRVFVQKCDATSRRQKWKVESINEEALWGWQETPPVIE